MKELNPQLLKMRKTLTTLALAGALAFGNGCSDERTVKESSDILYENALISDVVYNPSNHGSGVGPTIDFDGNVGVAITSVSIPEKYAVVFQCQHGKFIIEGKIKDIKNYGKDLIEETARLFIIKKFTILLIKITTKMEGKNL